MSRGIKSTARIIRAYPEGGASYRKSKKAIDVTLFNTERINVRQKNFGWADVTIKHPDTGEERTFKMRPKQIKAFIEMAEKEARGALFGTTSGYLYSHLIRETKFGRAYSARRHVEGILKVAVKMYYYDLEKEVSDILLKSDVAVEQWYNTVWLPRMDGTTLEMFYDYELIETPLLDIEEA